MALVGRFAQRLCAVLAHGASTPIVRTFMAARPLFHETFVKKPYSLLTIKVRKECRTADSAKQISRAMEHSPLFRRDAPKPIVIDCDHQWSSKEECKYISGFETNLMPQMPPSKGPAKGVREDGPSRCRTSKCGEKRTLINYAKNQRFMIPGADFAGPCGGHEP